MSNLQDAPNPQVIKKTSDMLEKAGFKKDFLKSAVQYVVSGNDRDAIADYGESPTKRFEKIVHAHNDRAGKFVRYKETHVGQIEEVVPLDTSEVDKLKAIGKFEPKKPFKFSIRWQNGASSFLNPSTDGFKIFIKKKKQQRQIS